MLFICEIFREQVSFAGDHEMDASKQGPVCLIRLLITFLMSFYTSRGIQKFSLQTSQKYILMETRGANSACIIRIICVYIHKYTRSGKCTCVQ